MSELWRRIKTPQTKGRKQLTFISLSSGGWMPMIQVSAGLVSPKASLLGV